MSFIINLFNILFYNPVVNLLVFIYNWVEAAHIPGALGIAIVLMTVVIRLLVWPFIATQLRSAMKMAELKPHIDALKTKHGKDKQALSQAQMALYKEHGVNPAGGCLPALIQLPIVLALANSIPTFFHADGINAINNSLYPFVKHLEKIPDPHFLGVDLAAKLIDIAPFSPSWYPLLIVPLLTAALSFVQSKMMAPATVKKYPSDSAKEKKEKDQAEDTTAAIQTQMLYMMPLMVGFFAYQFPVGLALYWNIFTVVGIVQQYSLFGWGGLSSLVAKLKTS